MGYRLLLITPINFFRQQHGNQKRFYELAKYLHEAGIVLDVFSPEEPGEGWRRHPEYDKEWIDNLYLFIPWRRRLSDIKSFLVRQFPSLVKLKNILPDFLVNLIIYPAPPAESMVLPDLASDKLKKYFTRVIKGNHYDFILMSYVYWANLFKAKVNDTFTKILLVEDFMTLNLIDAGKECISWDLSLADEVERMNLFDKLIFISEEERYLFSGLGLKPELHLVPFFMEGKKKARLGKNPYDIVLIASNNPHNIAGTRWFFDCVYPLLDSPVRILIVGLIVEYVSPRHNVTLLAHADDLDDVYRNARVAISPLIGGTGQKIKVVEAMAYGKPVVCTPKGAAGIKRAKDNGCIIVDSPKHFARALHRLLTDGSYYRSQSVSAREFFMKYYEKKLVCRELDKIFTIPG